jgi:outer membrane protein assembly factor BamB
MPQIDPARLRLNCTALGILAAFLMAPTSRADANESWTQYKYDSRHSGNVPNRDVSTPLGLIGTVPLTDAILTAPVVANGRVYVLDAAGTMLCMDVESLQVQWEFRSRGGVANCSNVSSPAISGNYLHFGTMAGSYYVLDAANGEVVKEIRCGEPIFSAPVVSANRVYFATLGSRVYSLNPDGSVVWTWDFVQEVMNFYGDRWNGADWKQHKRGKVTDADQFACSRNLAVYEDEYQRRMLVVPAGGSVVWVEDMGTEPRFRVRYLEPRAATPTLGLSIGEDGAVYRQWHWLDNRGEVDVYRIINEEFAMSTVPGTRTGTRGGLLSFCSVSLRGQDVYRCRPEAGFGLCKHTPEQANPKSLAGSSSIASPILLRDSAVYGGLDGKLHVVPLAGNGEAWSFDTGFGKAISAAACVCDGRIYFGCDDGYLYVLGPDGKAPLPTHSLGLEKIRSARTGERTDPKYDRFTSYGDWANTNHDQQGLEPPFQLKWIRRYEGTVKHFSTFGEGRMYTHTAEGQIFAVESETGRLLWRDYYPGVHICYTSPLYVDGRLLVPQAGLKECWLRCLDAATGELRWQAPFSGSPSWNRQQPPVVHDNLAIYAFSTGQYGADAPLQRGERRVSWLFNHGSVPRFPRHHKPLLRAYDLDTGEVVWEKDLSEHGAGGDDVGICLMDGVLYYSCFFGDAAIRRGEPGPKGLTAAIDPATGQITWLTFDHHLSGGCTISADADRLYLGGYGVVDETQDRYVWCLDARDGSLVWRSDPVLLAIQVVTVGPKFLFVHAQYEYGYLLDKETGKILGMLPDNYKCTRLTLSDQFLLGSNMDVIDISDLDDIRLVSTGPRVDPSECVGAVVSGGRLFYTGHGGGLQVSQVYGAEAKSPANP